LTSEDYFYLSPEILTPLQDDNKEEIIITINKEKEIFVDRPLTINDLPNSLQR